MTQCWSVTNEEKPKMNRLVLATEVIKLMTALLVFITAYGLDHYRICFGF